MDNELQVHQLEYQPQTEPTFHINTNQCVIKFLSAGTYEHGDRTNRLDQYSCRVGDLVICNTDTDNYIRWNSNLEFLKIEIPKHAFRAIAEELGVADIEIRGCSHLEDKRIDALISAIQAEREGGSLSGRLYMDAIGQALASVIIELRGVLHKPLRRYRGGLAPIQIARVKAFVQDHLGEDITLSKMSRVAGLSSAYFSQAFRRSTGVAPNRFLLNARIERAKGMLKQSEERIIDIAIACGFQTPQHFARVFRSICMVSPTEYRRDINFHGWQRSGDGRP